MEKKYSIDFNKVADIYDYYVNAYFDLSFFLQESESDNPVLELMCGSGRVSIPLLEKGRKMVCVDYSQGMLDQFAKKIENKKYNVELVNADVSKLSLNRLFDIAILPFHSLQEIISKEAQEEALQSIYNHLSPNGIFICSLQNPKVRLINADGAIRPMGRFPMNNSKEVVISYCNLFQDGIVSGFQKYEIFDKDNQLVEERMLDIQFRPIQFDEFNEMAVAAGYEIVAVYGNYDYSNFDIEYSPFMLFKLRKSV